ncbi:MAG TPA: hypothetical protein VHE37_02915, partial [Nevskiaceae bacterium]|nr:hypothetical protein [Nevskiaceae bacterium]
MTAEGKRLPEQGQDRADPAIHATVPELFQQQVRRSGNAAALRCGSRTLTYEAVERQANRIAHTLR